MRSLLQLSSLVALAALGAGCVRRYREPNLDEPHALVRVRVVRHAWSGPQLDESVRLDREEIPMPRAGPQPSIRAVRVRPGPRQWVFRTAFFHEEQRPQLETYQESYSCGSYTTYGYGGHSSTQSRTCYRTRTRTVWRTHRVDDATCAAGAFHVPREGAAYLVQYEFYGPNRCTAQCYRQTPLPGGQFRLLPCGPAEPPGEDAPVARSPLRPLPPRPTSARPPATTVGGSTPASALGRP